MDVSTARVWGNNRTVGLAEQAAVVFPSRVYAQEIIIPTLKWFAVVPSWVWLTAILMATTGVCITVLSHAHSELERAQTHQQWMATQVASLRQNNGILQGEIKSLTNDSNAIELAARDRLGMVRSNDIVIPFESITALSSSRSISFVR